MSTSIDTISNYVYGAEDAFSSVLVDRSLNFEREAGFAIQALTANDYAMGMAVKNKQSVINAVTNIAAIGISLNPAKRQAYLVPRDGKICLDISYMGLMDLAMSTGSILWAQAELVYEQDAFALNGFDKPPTHQYNPFAKDRGAIVGVYVVVKTPDGDYLTDCMSRDEVDAIMNRSQSVKSGKSSPWKTDYGEMAKKTVVKRAYKYWPKTDRLDKAIHHLNTDGGEGLATNHIAPKPDDYIDPAPIIEGLRATETIEQMKAYWADKNGMLARQPKDHQELKDAYLAHLGRLRAQANEPSPEQATEEA
jgi:recombination protein RecT